ncbi:DNA-binding transcriptional regulator, MarR family [Lentibacillus halodurans]|uniref:DNA-binding transcriptional regulator, MarR family n=1 Tax=Lentibacillus halodurans TaxID=237679 RepID=A0A1I0XMZ7_9BACI|nr:MarR family winged helix-turn-helix transcriptional regulator [Lentibacillus halodurans]SFB01670.1 DNA-binding transcriptional regulator, MarR family [Lentibacillus halodurans]
MDNNKENIKKIRRFNRFYLRMMGLFSQYDDQSTYSATEAMILFEIHATEKCTASYLADYFLLDKGYISRLLKRLFKEGMIEKLPSKEDRRIQYLNMTEKGERDLHELTKHANANVENMIAGISEKEIDLLVQAMRQIEMILKQNES